MKKWTLAMAATLVFATLSFAKPADTKDETTESKMPGK